MLTVIVPIYNEEKYIAQCIESIVAQDFPEGRP
ncbi:MAG: glycosyltransferase [Bacteroidales bacterium]|nr:glycosyltransferase [Bacteroidales bacterium]